MNTLDQKADQSNSQKLLINLSNKDNHLLKQFDLLNEDTKPKSISDLLHELAHLSIGLKEAMSIWKNVMDHRSQLNNALNREVGIRVALLDYLLNIEKRMKNPKIIEMEAFKKTQDEATKDFLTGLYNRRFFIETVDNLCHYSKRHDKHFGLLILDIDDFKNINDQYGHFEGDRVISHLADTIKKYTRAEDVACRLGGEEVAILFPDTHMNNAQIVTDKIRFHFCENGVLDKDVTVSGGLAIFPNDGNTWRDLYEVADQRLYCAKNNGKNRIVTEKEDNRKSLRQLVDWELHHTDCDERIKAKAFDFSFNGIAFETKKNIKVGSTIKVEVSKGHGSPISLLLSVRWVREMDEGTLFRVGTRLKNP